MALDAHVSAFPFLVVPSHPLSFVSFLVFSGWISTCPPKVKLLAGELERDSPALVSQLVNPPGHGGGQRLAGEGGAAKARGKWEPMLLLSPFDESTSSTILFGWFKRETKKKTNMLGVALVWDTPQ